MAPIKHLDTNLRMTSEDIEITSVNPDRVLASIVRITSITPIIGADRIVIAEIDGWRCIVQKSEFVIGDLAIYYSIDSIPDFTDPNLKFLQDKGITRIKTIKMKGVVSQGLLAPIKWLSDKGYPTDSITEGTDVTQALNVKKYIRECERTQYNSTAQELCEPFPKQIPKTDEIRLQTNLKLINHIIDRDIVITRKEDGCSCTFVYLNSEFKVCGRNYTWLHGNPNAKPYFIIEQKYKIFERLAAFNRNVGIQGEIIGPGINGNKLKLPELIFRVFNIYDIDSRQYLLQHDITTICTILELEQVPLLYEGSFNNLLIETDTETKIPIATFEDEIRDNDESTNKIVLNGLLAMADKQEYSKGNPAEGIVIKTADTKSMRISFKVISNRFLLKHDE
ncbi:MAG: RNA ligase [Gaeavirus sp.]|uniref:RNA ligase n=1 Tax=Gaeavirus sp. TaxID=2487767 RepID=A0A3G5A0N7_9VIRU|nr:MAG: RNA ligase [Gaeavirus sp.]